VKTVSRDEIEASPGAYLKHLCDYFDFGEDDAKLVKETGDALRNNITELMDEFYEKQLSYSTTASFFLNPDGTPKPEFRRAREGISHFLLSLAEGNFDRSFAESAAHIGDVHTRLKLEKRYMVGAASFLQQKIAVLVAQKLEKENADSSYIMKAVAAWQKLLIITLDLMLRNYVKLTYQDLIVQLREQVAIAERNRRQAELLQDILSHDITNYNQIILLNTELLKLELGSEEIGEKNIVRKESETMQFDPQRQQEALDALDSIVRTTKGSSELIQRTKKLGKIISEHQKQLYPVDLEDSLRRSVDLIKRAHPERSIDPIVPFLHSSSSVKPEVLADDLLDEVFTNILSNSVNYTEKDEVPVEIREEEVTEEQQRTSTDGRANSAKSSFWKITFTDHGKGIPNEMKEKMFTRYLDTGGGTGLGLSIVHALVVRRYGGRVAITDRVPKDHAKGTKVEVWLHKAD
jgi:signal transduction histidine kinase